MISELLLKFAQAYPELSLKLFKSTVETEILTSQIPQLLKQQAAISDAYKIYGSVGKGNWNEIPWVAILDKDISESTQDGYYIVFLFAADMKSIYLSLAVGWEQFEQEYGIKEGRNQIEQTVKHLQKVLRSPLKDFSFEKKSLLATHTLGKGYEVGGICDKKYDIDNIPNDSVIINDIRNLMGVYRELKGLVGKNVLNLELPEENINNEAFTRIVNEESEKVNNTEEAKKKILELTKDITNSPAPIRQKLASYVARNRKFSELIKEAANWVCEICGTQPFKKADGKWYAEAHHTMELASNRIDSPEVMICVCAQCHRIITYGTEEELEKRRKLKA